MCFLPILALAGAAALRRLYPPPENLLHLVYALHLPRHVLFESCIAIYESERSVSEVGRRGSSPSVEEQIPFLFVLPRGGGLVPFAKSWNWKVQYSTRDSEEKLKDP